MALSNIALIRNIHLTNKQLVVHARNIVSAIHIPGNKSVTSVSLVTPSLDHIDNLLDNKTEVEKSLKARNSTFDLQSFEKSWNEMKGLKARKEELEIQRDKVSLQIRDCVTKVDNPEELKNHVEQLKKKGKHYREQAKELNQLWWTVEEDAVITALKLPNLLHAKTPVEDQVIKSSKSPPAPEKEASSHRFSTNIEFVDHSPTAYYLKGPLAHMELELQRVFSRRFFDEGFHMVSAPDFVKSIVVEGCGLDFGDASRSLTLAGSQEHGSVESGNALHLVGGASLPALVAFLAKNVIQSPLPLRFASSGRHYQPATGQIDGLFGATQTTGVHLLSVMDNDPDTLYAECERIQNILADLLENELGVHFRICALSARHLEAWEQYRAAIQLYSPALKRYIQVGDVSIVGDYISRRLAIYGPDRKHPAFVSSTALNASNLMAAWMENKWTLIKIVYWLILNVEKSFESCCNFPLRMWM